MLLSIPFDCDAWHRNFGFAKFCLAFGLEWVQRKDQEMAFVTNCNVTRLALHGGDWRLTQGANEVEDLVWAEKHYGDSEVLSEVSNLLHHHEADTASERMETPKDRLEACMRSTLRGLSLIHI